MEFIDAISPAFLRVDGTIVQAPFPSLRLALQAASEKITAARTLSISCLFNDHLETLHLDDLLRLWAYV